ncbi:mortality factor 4-like protein [Pycnococcus provasolii]
MQQKKETATKKTKTKVTEPAAATATATATATAPEPEPVTTVNIVFPALLKRQLVEDHDQVKEANKLVPLPRSPTVAQILEQFVASKSSGNAAGGGASTATEKSSALNQLADGLRVFFDKTCNSKLLYANEREQNARHVPAGTQPSDVYGAEHLLRFFVRLPELLPKESSGDPRIPEVMTTKLHEILRFLSKNNAEFFVAAYVDPPSTVLAKSPKMECAVP